MLGIVFTEFMEMVETTFSHDTADAIIARAQSQLASRGIYTAVGNYSHDEMLLLVTELGQETGIPVPELVRAYGRHLFGRFFDRYPQFFTTITSSFDFLESIEDHIHREVRKLYPASELPHFQCERPDAHNMILTYSSSRPFAMLAHGLIEGCAAHFGETLLIDRRDLGAGDMTGAEFRIRQA